NMPEHIVKNVRLGNVFERIVAAQPCGGWKFPRRKHLKKSLTREKTAYGRGAPTRSRADSIADGAKIWQSVVLQADDFISFQIFAAGMGVHLRAPAAHEFSPNRVLFRGVVLVFLFDEIGCRCH